MQMLRPYTVRQNFVIIGIFQKTKVLQTLTKNKKELQITWKDTETIDCKVKTDITSSLMPFSRLLSVGQGHRQLQR